MLAAPVSRILGGARAGWGLDVVEFLKELLNPGWVSTTVSVVGLVVALLLYRASRIGGRLVYQKRGLRLIGPDQRVLPDGIEIRYKGQIVDRLTKTYLVFWNSGKVLLRGADIVEEDPLRCDFTSEARVLEVRLVSTSRTVNKFRATPDPTVASRVLISFDYLDPGDGATLEILHTDSSRYPKVDGTIKGVPSGTLDWGRILPAKRIDIPFPLNRRRNLVLVPFLLGLIIAISGLLPSLSFLHDLFRSTPAGEVRWPIVLAGLLYALLPLPFLWLTRRRFPRTLHSQELEE